MSINTGVWPALRIGQGYDLHALVPGRPLVLGGITIAHSHGLLGHSDADALLHAICDALLGAAGLGDIGTHFPDTDPAYAQADSGKLLQQVCKQVFAAGWRINNVDATLHAQAPKLLTYMPAMQRKVADLLGITPELVNLKAKTGESLGVIGRAEAIAAQVVVLLIGT